MTTCRHLQELSRDLKCSLTGTLPPISNINHATSKPKSQIRPKKWSSKKYLEVIHVGNFVGEISTRERCDGVVDVGSGLVIKDLIFMSCIDTPVFVKQECTMVILVTLLCAQGYLSGHIASEFEIPVIGIESEESRVKTAQTSAAKGSDVSQTFACLRISENICQEIEPLVKGFDRSCLTALHACGDLTPWALKYFVATARCNVVAVVPCCYHKMECKNSNFPLSQSLKAELLRYEDTSFLINNWLWRLACQRAGATFLNEIRKETNNLFYRAILERYILNGNKFCFSYLGMLCYTYTTCTF